MADPAAGAAEEQDPVQLAELAAALSLAADQAAGVTLEHGPAGLSGPGGL